MREDRNFRKLNQAEIDAICRLATRGHVPSDDLRYAMYDKLKVSYERMQGGFTACLLVLDRIEKLGELGEITGQRTITIWRGASRRSYKDVRKPIRGEMLAFRRAVLYSRPVTI